MPNKPNTIFQKLYDGIDQWQPSPELKENLVGGMKEVFKKLIEVAMDIINKEFNKKTP